AGNAQAHTAKEADCEKKAVNNKTSNGQHAGDEHAWHEYAAGKSVAIDFASEDGNEYAGHADAVRFSEPASLAAENGDEHANTLGIAWRVSAKDGNEYADAWRKSFARCDGKHAGHGEQAGNGFDENGAAVGDDRQRY